MKHILTRVLSWAVLAAAAAVAVMMLIPAVLKAKLMGL